MFLYCRLSCILADRIVSTMSSTCPPCPRVVVEYTSRRSREAILDNSSQCCQKRNTLSLYGYWSWSRRTLLQPVLFPFHLLVAVYWCSCTSRSSYLQKVPLRQATFSLRCVKKSPSHVEETQRWAVMQHPPRNHPTLL